MNINRKLVIIFGVSILLILIIFGWKAYYQERESQELTSVPNDIINYVEPAFDQNHPVSLEEVDAFQKACAIAVTPGKINKGIIAEQMLREVFCLFGKKDIEDKYISLCMLVKDISTLNKGQYIGIAVNYSDLLKKKATHILSEESSFNLCTITKPTLIEPFREELLLKGQINLNRNIVFPEGEVFCSKFFGLPDETLNLLITGFVPQTDLFQAKMYLISEDKTVNDILSQESFTKIEELLQSYPLLWNVEKPVI